MKNAATLFLLAALTACTGCESVEPTPVEVRPVEIAPVATTKFQVGDEVLFDIGQEILEGTIIEVGPIVEEVEDLDGTMRKNVQVYLIQVEVTRTTPDGVEMTLVLQGPAPEFALTRKRALNERGK